MHSIITIIIPCYNAEKYIDRCMESIEEQTIGMQNFQIILVDDASQDATMEKLFFWQAKYPHQIQIIHNQKNRRQGTCRNLGLKQATGDYVAFLDSDDWVEPDMYEKLYTVAQIGECDVVKCANSNDTKMRYCTTLQEKYTGKVDRLISIDTDEDRGRMIASNLLGTYVVTKLYRRSFIQENNLKFPENLLFEDIYWMGLLNCCVKRIGCVEERLYHYYMNPDSVSRIRNQKQNRDILDVNRRLWQTYQDRGLLHSGFAKALEFEMLCTYYLTTAKMIFLRYDELPYDMFYEMQADCLKMMPDYKENPYIEQYAKPFQKLMLGLLDKELTHGEIDSAANSLRILAHSDNAILHAEVEDFL